MKTNGFEVKNKGKTGEIWLYGTIGDDWDGVSAKTFASSLKDLGDVNELHVFINSPGGSVGDGLAIHSQLTRHSARKLVSIDGYALSAASFVAMAGDDITMSSGAMYMIHDPWTFAMGNAADLRATADVLDRHRDSILNMYETRSNLTRERLAEMMAAETWFNADEAIEYGFAHSKVEGEKVAACVDLSRFKYQNAPTFPSLNREAHERIAAAMMGM